MSKVRVPLASEGPLRAHQFRGHVGSSVQTSGEGSIFGRASHKTLKRCEAEHEYNGEHCTLTRESACKLLIINGGEGGIRTHGTRKGSTVFETARFNRSRTSPFGRACRYCIKWTLDPRLEKSAMTRVVSPFHESRCFALLLRSLSLLL